MRGTTRTAAFSLAAVTIGSILTAMPVCARNAVIAVAGAGPGTVTVKVPAGQTLAVTVTNNQNTSMTSSGNIDPATGTYDASGVQDNLTDTYTVTVGGETFKDVNGAQTKYTSQEEKAAPAGLHPQFLYALNGSASGLGSSLISFYDDPTGAMFAQFDLVNSSTTPLLLTSLQLDQNLNQSFFNQANFNSAGAISSGQLSQDYVSVIGNITILPGADMLFIEPAAAGPYQYDLLTGTVSAVGPNGPGPRSNFGIGASSVPEPATLTLFGIGLAAVFNLRRRPRTASAVV